MAGKRKGIAVVVVIFFAFAISIIMFTMFQSNTNLSNQTKQTIYAMQAYYLAHSCMQFGKLQISQFRHRPPSPSRSRSSFVISSSAKRRGRTRSRIVR